jgi:quercetin dioxygenase-like cupin family protein
MSTAVYSGPGDGEHWWFSNALVTIKVPGEAVGGRCAMIEFLMPRDLSPPLHHHPEDETFTMLDGQAPFVAGDQRFLAEPGASWVVPSGVAHTFRVDSDTALLVAVYAPAGIEGLFREAGLPAATPTLPPVGAPSRPLEEVQRLMHVYHHENVGPPLGPGD